jgi:hypothetical protein
MIYTTLVTFQTPKRQDGRKEESHRNPKIIDATFFVPVITTLQSTVGS